MVVGPAEEENAERSAVLTGLEGDGGEESQAGEEGGEGDALSGHEGNIRDGDRTVN